MDEVHQVKPIHWSWLWTLCLSLLAFVVNFFATLSGPMILFLFESLHNLFPICDDDAFVFKEFVDEGIGEEFAFPDALLPGVGDRF